MMTAANLRGGPVGIATGLRVPLANAHLDQLVNAIAWHAWERNQDGGFASAEDAVAQYGGQDDALYEVTDQIGREVTDDAEIDGHFILPLIQAVHGHREWQQVEHAFCDLSDVARRHHARDVALHVFAAIVRSAAARHEGAGICLDPEMVEAVLRGQKTVMRAPAELTGTGKLVRGHYKRNGGDGGTYALMVSPEVSAAECEVVPGCRLKVVSDRCEDFGDITEDDARREGRENRVDFFDHWWRLHGIRLKYMFEWGVRRYEFEVIEV